MFKYLSTTEFEALSEYQKEKYLDDKRKHEEKTNKDSAKAAATEAVNEAVETAKTELNGTIEAQKAEITIITNKLNSIQEEREAEKAENERIRIAAKENEQKGDYFDVALAKAFDSEEVSGELKQLKSDKNAKIRVTLKDVGTMGISSVTDISMANAQLSPGIRMLPNRRIHMRNIMSTGRMTTSDYHYLRETGGTNDPTSWTENSGAKQQLDLTYIEKVAPSEYVAGYLNISRKALDDITALRSAISQRLIEKYLIAEDNMILSGNGVAPQLDGLLRNAQIYNGTQTVLIDKLLDAAAQLEENEYYCDGILIKPRDWAAILRTKGNTDEYTMPGLGVVTMQNGTLYIGGIPVYKMNGMPSNNRQFLCADWMLSCQLLLREDPIVEISYENQDNFIKNIVTVRVEGRDALPIYYPEGLVKGSTGATT